MKLNGIHFLLSYQCTYECDHCFVWGSPEARGVMTLSQIRDVLQQASELGTVRSIFFEGGEPFLFYPIMLQGLREAAALGFKTGIVTNCYWATSVEDALQWLRPLVDLGISDLSLSSDLFHGESMLTQTANNATLAARQLGLPDGIISIEIPVGCTAYPKKAKPDPITGGQVRFRGRAAFKLVDGVDRQPWHTFTACDDEDLTEPGRVHVDTYGNLHVCQGITMGNLKHRPLKEILETYNPSTHPIIAPVLEKGPVGLVEHYSIPHEDAYVDACHLCYYARDALRARFPEFLTPGEMYGIYE